MRARLVRVLGTAGFRGLGRRPAWEGAAVRGLSGKGLPRVGDKVDITYKKDQEEVKILPDEEYPEWLWSIKDPTLKELNKKMEENFDEVTMDDLQRLMKLERRKRIRENNENSDQLR